MQYIIDGSDVQRSIDVVFAILAKAVNTFKDGTFDEDVELHIESCGMFNFEHIFTVRNDKTTKGDDLLYVFESTHTSDRRYSYNSPYFTVFALKKNDKVYELDDHKIGDLVYGLVALNSVFASRGFLFCDVCGEPSDELLTTLCGGKHVCDECKGDMELHECEGCGGLYEEEGNEVYNEYGNLVTLCDECDDSSFYCYYHGRSEIGEYYYVENLGEYVCEDALESGDYCRCYDCGEVYDSDELRMCPDGNERCEYCVNDYEENNSGLNSYSYKPMPEFVRENGSTASDDDGELYMGIELETDSGDPNALVESLSDLDHIYMKSDGSLDNGVEIVTHPLHYKYAYNWDGWEIIRNKALEANMRSHDAGTCGLHVHVNCSYLGQTDIVKDYNISKLVFLFDKFENDLTKFSRRKLNQITDWCGFSHAGINGDETNEERSDKLSKAKYSRYRAINLCNYSTVEIRLWRGTLNLNTLLVTLDFTQAVVRFVKEKDYPDMNRLEKFNDLLDALKPYAFNYDAMKEYADSRGCE